MLPERMCNWWWWEGESQTIKNKLHRISWHIWAARHIWGGREEDYINSVKAINAAQFEIDRLEKLTKTDWL